jgi:hypothetical protein
MIRTPLFAFAALLVSSGIAHGATFNYHGNLQDAGKPAEGSYDLELTLYSAAEGGRVVAGPLLMYRVPVQGGSFSTEADFGPVANATGPAWLSVKVRKAGNGEFAALSARAPLGADTTATNNSCPGSWALDGNAGNLVGSFLGTADAKDVVIKSNNQNVLVAPAASFAAVGLSGALTTSAGTESTAVSDAYAAKGAHSFAGGFSAGTSYHGSFVWGDDWSSTELTDSGPNQFIMKAQGGVAINGVPKDSSTELTIYPSANNGGDFSEIFMGQRALAEGIRITAGNASAGFNDSTLYVDEYDGTTVNRQLTVGGGTTGTVVSATNYTGDGTTDAQLRVVYGAYDNAGIELHANTSDQVYYQLQANSGGAFYVYEGFGTDSNALIKRLRIQEDGTFQVYGDAYKPTAGGWLASSDRRIKRDVQPVGSAVATLERLRPVTFHYTPEYRAERGNFEDRTYWGFIAQEFAEVFPEAVKQTDSAVPGAVGGEPGILALDPNPALITTVAAIQELAVENAALHEQLDATNANLADLRERLSRLERKGE